MVADDGIVYRIASARICLYYLFFFTTFVLDVRTLNDGSFRHLKIDYVWRLNVEFEIFFNVRILAVTSILDLAHTWLLPSHYFTSAQTQPRSHSQTFSLEDFQTNVKKFHSNGTSARTRCSIAIGRRMRCLTPAGRTVLDFER